MTRLRLHALAVLILGGTASPLSAAAGEWSSPTLGGGGGEPFAARCEPGEYLAGLHARVGDDLDQVGSVCARQRRDGTRKRPASRGGGGGGGGAPQQIVCPDDAPFVRSLDVGAEGVDALLVNSARIVCAPLVGALPRSVEGYNVLLTGGAIHHGTDGFSAAAAKSSRQAFGCPDGMAPVGVHGRAGAMVDALGLMCATLEAPPPESAVGEQKVRDGVTSDAVTEPPPAPPAPAEPPPPPPVVEQKRRGPYVAP